MSERYRCSAERRSKVFPCPPFFEIERSSSWATVFSSFAEDTVPRNAVDDRQRRYRFERFFGDLTEYGNSPRLACILGRARDVLRASYGRFYQHPRWRLSPARSRFALQEGVNICRFQRARSDLRNRPMGSGPWVDARFPMGSTTRRGTRSITQVLGNSALLFR